MVTKTSPVMGASQSSLNSQRSVAQESFTLHVPELGSQSAVVTKREGRLSKPVSQGASSSVSDNAPMSAQECEPLQHRRKSRKRPRGTKTRSKVEVMKPSSEVVKVAQKSKKRSATSTVYCGSTKKHAPSSKIPCGICFDEDFKLQGVLDCCKHVYCYECIQQWSGRSNQCPQCKRRFVLLSLHNVSDGKLKSPLRTETVAHRDYGTTLEQESRAYMHGRDVNAIMRHFERLEPTLLDILHGVLDRRLTHRSAQELAAVQQQHHHHGIASQHHQAISTGALHPQLHVPETRVVFTPQHHHAPQLAQYAQPIQQFADASQLYVPVPITTSQSIYTTQTPLQPTVQVMHQVSVQPQLQPSWQNAHSVWVCCQCHSRQNNWGWCGACGAGSNNMVSLSQWSQADSIPVSSASTVANLGNVYMGMSAMSLPQLSSVLDHW